MACLFTHKWNGCKCEKCGKFRDEQHDFNSECKCRRCGQEHDWEKRVTSSADPNCTFCSGDGFAAINGQWCNCNCSVVTREYYVCKQCKTEKD